MSGRRKLFTKENFQNFVAIILLVLCLASVSTILVYKVRKAIDEVNEMPEETQVYIDTIRELRLENKKLSRELEDVLDDSEKRVTTVKKIYKDRLRECRNQLE